MEFILVGFPGWGAESVSERASWRPFSPLKHSITSHCLLKHVQFLKTFIEWTKSFPLALLARLDYGNSPCIFIFHYSICLPNYLNTFFFPRALSVTWKKYSFEIYFTIYHSHFFPNVCIVCTISISIHLTSSLFRHIFIPTCTLTSRKYVCLPTKPRKGTQTPCQFNWLNCVKVYICLKSTSQASLTSFSWNQQRAWCPWGSPR